MEDAVAECTGINVNDEGLYQSKHNLSDKGIEVRRFNEDKLVNNNGRLLLDFCKGLDLHIVNGRVGNDLGRGKLTCKNTSTIEYVIASLNCFQLIKDFDVDIFDSFLSDVHSPLCFTLVHMLDKNETADVEINLPILPATDEAIRITKWDQSLCSNYIDAFDLDRLHRLGINLNACNTGNVSQIEIDTYVHDLCDIYLLPAKLCGMEKTYRQNTVTKAKKNTPC